MSREEKSARASEEHNKDATNNPQGRRFCALQLQDSSNLAAQFALSSELGLPPLSTVDPGELVLSSRRSVILCTALLYVRVTGIKTQQQVFNQQVQFVSRLMDIESRRVHADFDQPIFLTQAKQLRARTRLESLALSAAEHESRTGLSALIGIAPDQLDVIGDSIPPLPENLISSPDDTEVLQQLLAIRDVVQLDYFAEYTNRLRATQDMVLAKASIGRLVAAHVNEEMKLNALLEVNNQIRLAKIQFLAKSGGLEDWAFGRKVQRVNSPSAPVGIPAAEPPKASTDAVSSVGTPSILSILISPAIKKLEGGRSQQFSAIATFSDGHAKDVTAEANWSCSSDTVAVLSTTGLLTGLAVGEVDVNVEYQGLAHSRRVSVTEAPVDEYLLPGH